MNPYVCSAQALLVFTIQSLFRKIGPHGSPSVQATRRHDRCYSHPRPQSWSMGSRHSMWIVREIAHRPASLRGSFILLGTPDQLEAYLSPRLCSSHHAQSWNSTSAFALRGRGQSTLSWCPLLISRLIPNKTPRKLEVLTSVFWGGSFCASQIGKYIISCF